MHRSHVQCSVCATYKPCETQGFTEHQIEDYRRGKSKVVCADCRSKGRTSYNKDDHRCDACKEAKGRLGFRKHDLNVWQKKKKAGKQYTLMCIACREQEPKLQKIFDSLDARMCRRCLCDMYKHKDDCKMRYSPCLTERDLEIFGCKPTQRDMHHTTYVAYYRRIGALIE